MLDDTNEPDHNNVFTASSLTGEPPPRVWAVEGYIPQGNVTGMFGAGGVGKSLIAQQLATVMTAGESWLGIPLKQGAVLGYFCEDDRDELWRRQHAINEGIGLPPESLNEFYMQSRTGMENILMRFEGGIGVKTKFFKQVEEEARDYHAKLLILDNTAQMFGGNENDRSQVTQFVNSLHGLIAGGELAILLLGHPPKITASGVQADYSGSTAWDACFRSRLFFGRPEHDEDENEEDNTSYRVLTKKKANYSSVGDEVKVKWEKGFFRLAYEYQDKVKKIEISNKLKEAKAEFCKILAVLNKRGQEVSHAPTSQNYAPRFMKKMPSLKPGLTYKLLVSAMDHLIDEGVVEINHSFGRVNGREKIGLKLVKADK